MFIKKKLRSLDSRRKLYIGSTIRYIRKAMELSQVELSMKLHITQTTFSRMETGSSIPNILEADRLLELTGLPYEAIMKGYNILIASVKKKIIDCRLEDK